jgi:SH3-like domain-containing protein
MDAPTNIGAAFFTYCESNGSQIYTDDPESEIVLRPNHWNVLVWEVPNDNNASDIGIGLRFRLIPKEEIEWVRGSEFAWEEAAIYIDAVQIMRRSPTGQSLPVELPSETPTGSPLEPTPSPEAPTATQTPVALATSPSLPSTPVLAAVVTAEALNLRIGPGMGYAIIRTLKAGETLTLLGRTSNGYWLHVRTSELEEGWVSASFVDSNKDPATVPTAASTPTRTLLDAPTPLSPLTEDEARFVNQVKLEWLWIRPLAESECFSVRVSRQDTGEICFHDKTQDPVYSGPLLACNSGKLFWETVVARLLSRDPERWLELSPTSEPQFFDFVREKPVPPTDTPVPSSSDNGDDDNGDGDNGGGGCKFPPC